MYIFQKQYTYSVFRIRNSHWKFVLIKKFVKAWCYMLCFFHHSFSLNIFSEGIKLVGKSCFFDFIISITVSNYIYISFKVKIFKLLNFTFVQAQYITLVKADNIFILVKDKSIGVNILVFNSELSNNRNYKFFKTA